MIQEISKYITNKRGALVLPIVIMLGMASTIVALNLFSLGTLENQLVVDNEDSARAFWMAEAALQKFMYDLYTDTIPVDNEYAVTDFNNDIAGGHEFQNLTNGFAGALSYTFFPPGNAATPPVDPTTNAVVLASGTFNGVTGTIRVERDEQSIFNFAFYDVGANGGPASDTFPGVGINPYNSLTINGNVYVGDTLHIGSINPAAAITINGNVITTGGVVDQSSPILGNADLFIATVSYNGKSTQPAYRTDLGEEKMVPLSSCGAGASPRCGYYYRHAVLRVRSSGIYTNADVLIPNSNNIYKTKSFYNQAYGKYIDVIELNIEKLKDAWPSNGLIYSSFPLRIKNASKLKTDLMIVSNADIYIKGDFNSVNSKAAVLMTTHRVIYLSKDWKDNKTQKGKVGKGDTYQDHIASGDMTVNAARVDGTPFICANNWVTDNNGTPGDNSDDFFRLNGGAVFDGNGDLQPPPGQSNACGGSLLEKWGSGRTLTLEGPVVHFRSVYMNETDLDNSIDDEVDVNGVDEDNDGTVDYTYTREEMDWVKERSYDPPERAFNFERLHSSPNSLIAPYIPRVYTWRGVG